MIPFPARRRPLWIAAGLAALAAAFLLGAMVVWRHTTPPFRITVSPDPLIVHPGAQDVAVKIHIERGGYDGPLTVRIDSVTGNLTAAPLMNIMGSDGTLALNASPHLDQKWDENTTVIVSSPEHMLRQPLGVHIPIDNPAYAPPPGSSRLPTVHISTDGIPLSMDKSKVSDTLTITSPDGQTQYLHDAGGTIHLRGNTTLDMPKKSFTIKLGKGVDLMKMLGVECPYVDKAGASICNKSTHYALLANWTDKTFLRTWAAAWLANAIPIGGDYLDARADSPTPSGTDQLMPWAPHSVFVSLYLNGDYLGVYQLIEKIKIDRHAVNINRQSQQADLTGGYIVEIDDRQSHPYHFTTPQGLNISLRDPKEPKGLASPAYIALTVGNAENALFSSEFTDPHKGWRAHFDEASVVNFYLVNEITGNVDGGSLYSSDYLYKAPNNPLLYMGPVWDFDISAGNVDYYPVADPTEPWMAQSLWYERWFQDPGFQAAVRRQFNTLKSHHVFERWFHAIRRQSRRLAPDAAYNYQRWPTLDVKVWPNPQVAGGYQEEVDYFLDYLRLRIAYLDSVLNHKAATHIAMHASTVSVRAGDPFTLNAHVESDTAPGGRVTFILKYWEYPFTGPSAPVDASGDARVTFTRHRPGQYKIFAVYSGDSENALSKSEPVTVEVKSPR